MALLDGLRSQGLAKGVFGTSRFWLVVAGVTWGIRALSWALRPREDTVFRQAIQPGQTLTISAVGPTPTRRETRRAAKAERRLGRREIREQVATARMRRRHRVL
jgi:hypothetical protein